MKNIRPVHIVIVIVVVVVIAAGVYYYMKKSGKLKGSGSFAKSLGANAVKHWNLWNQGNIKEGDHKTMDLLRSYWRDGAKVLNWSDQQMISEAWSSAFISKMVKDSGGGDDFRYSPSHSVYTVAAIKNRKENNSNPFKGYRPEEVKLQVGDIIVYPRQAGVSYDSTGQYLSHGDIVVSVKGNVAKVIGGNVSNSVTMKEVPLDNGKIDLGRSSNPYFVVIKKTS